MSDTEKSENQTECLKVTNDQTCLSQNAADYNETHSQPKSAQTSAATAEVISRNTQKLLIHRGNGAMSLSVSLLVLLF